ncbi:MAG: aminotransferase class III-fold pyridoxal phosphate-dependent enzyme [Lentisphaerae bacterium]|nr:aminotransferase class III-fold pyridoxal phosphate-dependent enzyme [Lentisphaerota bacterium]
MTPFHPVKQSLADLAGDAYIDAVCRARAFLTGEQPRALSAAARRPLDFYPVAFQRRLHALLPWVGRRGIPPLRRSAAGATTAKFEASTHTETAPLSGLGFYRLGEDGRLFLISKSEHYHAPLGHGFPGYALLETAKALGIPNATHNNTRGHITRRLEEELIRTANGLSSQGGAVWRNVLASRRPDVVNRVLNLETGSLAVEAALKMVLGRFYKCQADFPEPVHRGRIPVLIVVGDTDGGLQANYHGTTTVTQTLRGLWPEIRARAEHERLWLVRSIRPNCIGDLEALLARYDRPPYKVAGFFHELIMMNYGGLELKRPFLRRAYALCRRHDVPTVVDEIQSCMWSPVLYLYREYGLKPSFVAVGKGFPGGEYPASRLLFSAAMDCLPQFGALVTNGQEELASLAYLVTMRWALTNADITEAIGAYYEERLRELGRRHRTVISAIEGCRHLAALYFHDLAAAKRFVADLNGAGLDISVQTYKSECPPSALTKLPLTVTVPVVDAVLKLMEQAVSRIALDSAVQATTKHPLSRRSFGGTDAKNAKKRSI